jgi:DNA-directed RNA polymerase specialized sigma subunit|tara:strand:+ start:709 stop:954 length:246 start_codon:yes stop_codon:yes gene_type:complete
MNEEANALMNTLDTKKIVLEELHNVAYLIKDAQDLVNSLKDKRINLIKSGKDKGVSLTDMAKVLDISRQRIYQILDSNGSR